MVTDKPLKGDKGDRGEPGMTRNARRAFLVLTVLILAVALAGLLIGTRAYNGLQHQQARDHHRLLAQCGADRSIGDLARLQVTVNPKTHKASKQLLGIIAAHRVAFTGLDCAGRLKAPSPSYRHWAALYRLPPG